MCCLETDSAACEARIFGPTPIAPAIMALGHRLTGSQALPLSARRGALCQEYSQVSLPSHGTDTSVRLTFTHTTR